MIFGIPLKRCWSVMTRRIGNSSSVRTTSSVGADEINGGVAEWEGYQRSPSGLQSQALQARGLERLGG